MPGLNLFTLLALAVPGSEPGSAEVLRRAEEAFQRGVAGQARVQQAQRHFAAAADLFDQLRRRGVSSAALYLDLGNAEYLAGRPERAVWAYLCGLQLDPNQRLLRQHLALARTHFHYPPGGIGRPAPDPWPAELPRPTPLLALLTAGAAYTLACIVATWWLRRRSRGLLLTTLALVALAAGSLLLYSRLLARAEEERIHPQVVLIDETPLYRGNGTSYPTYPDLPPLPRGAEVRRVLRRGGWLQVRLATGEVGWLPAAAVLIVEVPPVQ